ncbi:MAG TPA: 23S rRNA (adenine(2503)-C(2))-methyltransferase RlmN [Alphaproteobacteria bacterium]|nr:23S rRNA (adenine(2503)-C(2))-methyltransferase RlmN [Alphaproteobacteria bacterium]
MTEAAAKPPAPRDAIAPRAEEARHPDSRGDQRLRLIGLDRADFAALMEELGEKPFRAGQLWAWVYGRGLRDFEGMTTLSKAFRARLEETCSLARPAAAEDRLSADTTRKWLFRFTDGQLAETVFIPNDDRGSLCISSQVGCTLNCRFCHTGTQRLVRNLDAGEIVGQLMAARDAIGEWGLPSQDRKITNIVMMGMGEPLYNFDNVAKALRITMDPEGLSISKRRITLSTAGVVPMMARCGEELGVNLAVSLHAVSDDIRDELVPLNRKYPIKELLAACRAYPGVHNARRITFEYVMLKGVNDSPADARALVRLLKGIPAKTNLIPFNPWPGAPYECSSDAAIAAFARIVNDGGLSAPVRAPRGRDILAACGQLKTASVRRRRSQAADGPAR